MSRAQRLVLFFFILFAVTVNAEEKFRVGVIIPLSGDGADVGEAIRNGMTLALESLPLDDRERVELVYEDDAMKAKNSIAAFHRLSLGGGVRVVVSASSGTSKALAPLAEDKRIPLVALATDPAVSAGKTFAVNFWTSAREEAGTLFPEAMRRGYRRIARITTIQDFTLAMKTAFDEINKGNIQIQLDEEYDPAARDFRTFIARIRAAKDLDAVFVGLYSGQIGLFARQLRQMGINLPMFGFEMFEDANEVKLSEGALVGQWYVNNDEPGVDFVNRYQKRFPNASFLCAPGAHDILMLLAEGAKQNMTSAEFNKYIHSLKDFSGALGTYSSDGKGGFTMPAAIKVVTKEGFAKIN